jgi:hypothetical protein
MARKQRPKPVRHVCLLLAPGGPHHNCGDKETSCYLLRNAPCDLGQGLSGYLLERVSPDAEHPGRMPAYHIVLDARHGQHRCECMGHVRHGRQSPCQHIAALLALDKAGQLPKSVFPTPAYRSAAEYAATDPDSFDRDMGRWSDETPELPDAAYHDAADIEPPMEDGGPDRAA